MEITKIMDLEGAANIASEQVKINISAHGQHMTAEINRYPFNQPSVILGFNNFLILLKQVAKTLNNRGLTLTIMYNRQILCLIGRDANPGLLSRIFRFEHIQLKNIAVLIGFLLGSLRS
jgi:hypothetical protein